MEGIKGIERICRNASFIVSRRVRWLSSRCNRRIRRNGQDHLTGGLEGSGGGRRQFVMRLDILIHEVAVKDRLISTEFVLEIRVTAPAFRTRERQRELVKVESIGATAPIFVCAGRS